MLLDLCVIGAPVAWIIFAPISFGGNEGVMIAYLVGKLFTFLGMTLWAPLRFSVALLRMRREVTLRRDLRLTLADPADYLRSRARFAFLAATAPVWLPFPIEVIRLLVLLGEGSSDIWSFIGAFGLVTTCEVFCLAVFAFHAAVSLGKSIPIRMSIAGFWGWQAAWVLISVGLFGINVLVMSFISGSGITAFVSVPILVTTSLLGIWQSRRIVRGLIPRVFPDDEETDQE